MKYLILLFSISVIIAFISLIINYETCEERGMVTAITGYHFIPIYNGYSAVITPSPIYKCINDVKTGEE